MDSDPPTSIGLSEADRRRIQAFADAHGVEVHVVGSRAAETATVSSDYDYIVGVDGGTSRLRQAARRELPRGPEGGEVHPTRGELGIDLFREPLDPALPHVTFRPSVKRLPR